MRKSKNNTDSIPDISDAEQKLVNYQFEEFMKFAPQSEQARLHVAGIVDKAINLKDSNVELLKAMRKIIACCEAAGNPMDIVTADIYSIANEALKNNITK